MDAALSSSLKSSAGEELKLFDEIATLAKTDPDFDEGPVIEKYNELMRARQGAQSLADEQMKKIQKLYDLVDGRITYVDSCTRDIAHLLPQGTLERGGSVRKKKRKKSSVDEYQSQSTEDVLLEGGVLYDPNEPVYCTCRQISFGNMIACENPECSIEWFHFGCVGLSAEPNEPWYCAQCRDDVR